MANFELCRIMAAFVHTFSGFELSASVRFYILFEYLLFKMVATEKQAH